MAEVQTNYVNTDSKDPNVQKAPDNFSDFIDQAKKFHVKAQSQGVSNTAVANTIKMFADLTAKNIAQKDQYMNTPSQQAAADVAQGQLGINQQAETRLKGLADQETMDATITGADFGLDSGSSSAPTPSDTTPSAWGAFQQFKASKAQKPADVQNAVVAATQAATAPTQAPAQNWQAKYQAPVMGGLQKIASGTFATPWSR